MSALVLDVLLRAFKAFLMFLRMNFFVLLENGVSLCFVIVLLIFLIWLCDIVVRVVVIFL